MDTEKESNIHFIIKCRSCGITEEYPLEMVERSFFGAFLKVPSFQCSKCWDVAETYYIRIIPLKLKEA